MNDYRIAKTRRKSGAVSVMPTPTGTGFKGRAARLAECFGKWCHRWNGYVMSPKRAAQFEQLYAEGYDGGIMSNKLIPPNRNPPSG